MPHPNRFARSYLYVPADAPARLSGATGRGADAVIADLEDSVAASSKSIARDNAREWLIDGQCGDLAQHDDASLGHRAQPLRPVERWVRINPGEMGLDDLAHVLQPGATGVCLPKVNSRADIYAVSEFLDGFEKRHHLASGAIVLMPLIETAAGVQALREIAECPRVHKLQIGELDLAADLALNVSDEEVELLPLRLNVVVASAAAGLAAPVGAVSPDFRDLERFALTTGRQQRTGFFGRAAIHPAQLETIHQAFSVTAAELGAAHAAVELYESHGASGVGAIVGGDGTMIDEAVIRRSRRVIEVAKAAGWETTL